MYNVITSIVFSASARSLRKNAVCARLKTYGELVPGPLTFGWQCLPIEALEKLEEELRVGEIKVWDRAAKLGASVTLSSFTGTISEHSGYIRNLSSLPVWHSSRSTFPADAIATELGRTVQYVNGPEILRQLSLSGFCGFRELATNYLDASNTDPSGPSCIEILAPVPVRVTGVEIDPAKKRVRVNIERHRHLHKTLRLRGDVFDGQWQRNQVSLAFGAVVKDKQDFAFTDAPFELSSLDSHVQLRVVHDRLGIISTPRFSVRQHVPRAYINPMFESFKRFCSSDELRSLCTEPKTLPKDNNKGKDMPQRMFENHIQWLLSCFGFSAVQLGSKESLYEIDEERDVKMVRGSRDLLAYNEQRRLLLLGSCKLNPPPDKDFNNLINLKAALTKTISPEAEVNIALAVFTSADHCLPHAGYRGENFVAVFDKRKISSLINALDEGQSEAFHQSLFDSPEELQLDTAMPSWA